jgi:hypothetical protein
MTCQRAPVRSRPKKAEKAQLHAAVATTSLPVSSGKGPLKKRTSFIARPAASSKQFAALTRESLDAHMSAVSDVSTMSSSDQETLSEASSGSSASLSLFQMPAPLTVNTNTPATSQASIAPDSFPCALTVLAAWMAAQQQASASNFLATTLSPPPPIFAPPPPPLTSSQLAVLAALIPQAFVTPQPVAPPINAPILPKEISQVAPGHEQAPTEVPSQLVAALIQQAFATTQSAAVAGSTRTSTLPSPVAPIQQQPAPSTAAAPIRSTKRPSRMESVSKSLETIQDKSFVENALKRRDEQERARVAQSMLLQSFVAALQQQGTP